MESCISVLAISVGQDMENPMVKNKKKLYMYLCGAQDESLAEHDKKYHPNGWKKDDRCKVRGKMSDGDPSDMIDKAKKIFGGWIDGLKINEVENAEPRGADVRLMLDPKAGILVSNGGRMAKAMNFGYNPRETFVISKTSPDIVSACIAKKDGVDVKDVVNTPFVIFNRFFHCMTLPDPNVRYRDGFLTPHGIKPLEIRDAFQKLEDPVMVLPPSEESPDTVRVVIDSKAGIPMANDIDGYCVIPIMLNQGFKNLPKDRLGKLGFVVANTMYPLNNAYVDLAANALASGVGLPYVNRDKTIELLARMKKTPTIEKAVGGLALLAANVRSAPQTSQQIQSPVNGESIAQGEDRGNRVFDVVERFSKTCESGILGWYDRKTGDVSLVKGKADVKTVAHEIGWHATYHWAEKNAPELYKKLREYAKTATDSVKMAVRTVYGGDLSEDALLDEIGAERFTRDHMGVIEDAVEKRRADDWWDGVEETCDDTRKAFVRGQELSDDEIGEIARMEPKKAVEALVEAMLSGRTLGKLESQRGGVAKSKTEDPKMRYLMMVDKL